MMTFAQEYQQAAWSQVVFIDPLPTRQPMPAPFLESVDIGDGFTLTRVNSLWELRRGQNGGIYIARFVQWSEAVGCAATLEGNLDCWDLETVPDAIARYNGLGYEVKL